MNIRREITLDVSPTFTSTDLLTPSSKPRDTLPTIAKFCRPLPTKESSRWGAVTVRSIPVTVPYDLTHRRYGTGCHNYVTCYQPYRITSLMLSNCRKNDQRLCPPEKLSFRYLNHGRTLAQCPKENTNFSHISKFSMFPQPFSTQSHDSAPSERNKALVSLQQSVYTSCYQETYRHRYSGLTESSSNVVFTSAREEQSSKCLKETHVKNSHTNETPISRLINESDATAITTDDEKLFHSSDTSVSREAQTDCRQLNVDAIFHKRFNSILLLPVNKESFDYTVIENQRSKKDTSTQTVIPVSLVKEKESVMAPLFCRGFPSAPSMVSTPFVDKGEDAASIVMPRIHRRSKHQSNQLSSRFKARLRYNEIYGNNGDDDRNHLCGQWRSARKMCFYGEQTAIFR